MSSDSGQPEFSRWRSILWPVHRFELKKLIPMLLIFFLISFDYNVLRTLKDTLVVTARSSGAEAIPFIKVWVMFPGAIGMIFLFTRLSNRLQREKVFYLMMTLFLAYFALFIFVLYPMRDSLHPHELADSLQEKLPLGFMGLIAMFRNWTFTTFYAMSELWGNIILFVLFWGFANQVTALGEAKRFYSLFGIGANFSGVVAGQVSVWVCRHSFNPHLPFGESAWEQSMMMLLLLVLLAGVAALLIFRWMHTSVLTDPRYFQKEEEKIEGTKKMDKQSVRNNFAYLLKSRYLTCIALIVITYNLVINLVEVVWKHQLKELYPNPADYNLYFNQVTIVTGIVATTVALFISGNSIRRLGWTFTAMLTPMILLLTSVAFFSTFFLKEQLYDVAMMFFGSTPLALVVLFGSLQNVLSRAAKYTVYDETKEIAFIPLSPECKIRGKAAIDGVCSRLGKSGGAVVHQTLLLTFSSVTASAPYVAAILLGVIATWIGATSALGKQFKAMTTPPPPVEPKREEREEPWDGELEQLQEQRAI